MNTQILQNENGTTKVNGVTIPNVKAADEVTRVAEGIREHLETKVREFVNHYDEVLTKTMFTACETLKLNTREREEMVLAAVRNSIRAKLSSETKNLKVKLFGKQRDWMNDGMTLENIKGKSSGYEKDIIAMERLYVALEK